MENKNQNKNRRSIRLKEYDYSEAGDYFITICTQNRECLFGDIVDGEMRLNEVGKMIKKVIEEIPMFYLNIEIDIFSIMPNHVHIIICIVGADPCVRPIENGQTRGFAPTEKQPSLPQIVQRFKSLITKQYIDGVKNKKWKPFENRIFQRNYYEHIIRNEKSYDEIYTYIESNPQTWDRDRNNPNNLENINI